MPAEQPLAPVSFQTQSAFKARADDIIRLVVARSLEHTEQVAGHGADAERLLTAGLRYTTLGLQTALLLRNTTLLGWQLRWAADRLPHDGVQPEHILTRLQIYAQVVAELLPPEHAAPINAYVNWMIAYQQARLAAGDTPPD